jgi:hypothetical protein
MLSKKLLSLCIFINLFHLPIFSSINSKEIAKKIRDLNMQMFKWEWGYPDSDGYPEYLA